MVPDWVCCIAPAISETDKLAYCMLLALNHELSKLQNLFLHEPWVSFLQQLLFPLQGNTAQLHSKSSHDVRIILKESPVWGSQHYPLLNCIPSQDHPQRVSSMRIPTRVQIWLQQIQTGMLLLILFVQQHNQDWLIQPKWLQKVESISNCVHEATRWTWTMSRHHSIPMWWQIVRTRCLYISLPLCRTSQKVSWWSKATTELTMNFCCI